MTAQHLILFDGPCPLCNRAISFILHADKKKQFLFAHLQGKTAQDLKIPPTFPSMVLIENYTSGQQRQTIEGKATFRIFWLLGGWYRLLGLFSFMPSKLFDLGYRFVAKRRHTHFTSQKTVPRERFEDRFLD